MIIGSTQHDREREDVLSRQILTGAADGIILLTGRIPEALRSYPGFEKKIVAVGRALKEPACVNIDNEKAIATAVNHLVERGYSDIAHLDGPKSSPTFSARIRGYQAAMEEAGISSKIRVAAGERFNIEAGRDAMESLMRDGSVPAAVVCASDEMAMGAIRYARSQGLTVPQDIAVVGFDDIPFAGVYEPPLTTIRTPRRKMGELGAQMLLKNLKSSSFKSKSIILDHELIVRESSGGEYGH
ncbi:substrate-binding domain-containing protein [Rhizobium leguminosarum]|nr:substrate-binding domain-containing protein [Rhizobium leguminosarum]